VFGTVLIANRGEIALRVLRACRELGIRTVAVHSTEDKDSAAVRMADQAVQIGPAPSRQSYLNAAAIIEAARATGAEAVHPGYGFLSENPDFAEVCEANGLTFIGPPADVIATLGDKTAARAAMTAAGLPLLPGSVEPLNDAESAAALADEIGYPVIIKAAAGGGGRGMSIVEDPAEFAKTYQQTRATAQVLFGDGRVYVERYLASARHVEIQVLCDKYGNAVHLGERDCSVQRRHQKLVEETPAPGLPAELTKRMGEAAVRGALATGYLGAGTFEFIVDTENNYYFMEVNCRIQVEHPVTEAVTGVDLIIEQLKIAAGEPMRLRQEDIRLTGAAIECRVNVEDPAKNFVPTPGVLEQFIPPGGPFVRVDTHGYAGYKVPAAYDSLLAKVIVWAPDREQAIRRMRRALAEFTVEGPGIRTTREFLDRVLADPLFAEAKHDTSLVAKIMAEDS
jgi:acetyl-CoA carboxylase biotin carboxylase subunit